MPPPLTLKQRLAALSNGPKSPTSLSHSHGPTPTAAPLSPTSPTFKRKPFFNAPWAKRPPDSAEYDEIAQREILQEVMAKMIFQAGGDFETRPMVVVCAAALPNPREVSYDLLLSRILSYLNLYVEADYTVVFFAAGGRHTPGWNWVWKAYRSLNRKYRKNLKRLYIVHSSFFSKMLFSLAGTIISPKFFRKISYIDTLSELASFVPLTQIDVPSAVYAENLKHEREITLPSFLYTYGGGAGDGRRIFGVPLEELMGIEGERGSVPKVVRDCVQFLRENGLEEHGLFRRSPSSAMLRAAQDAYDRGNVVSLETFSDPHLAAVLLKKYLRDLPDPIFAESLYPTIRRCPAPTSDPADMNAIIYIRETLLPEIMPCAQILLSFILHLLHEVSLRSASNRMDAHNLGIVICPNLVKSPNPAKDVMMCTIPGGPSPFESNSQSSSGTSSPNRAALLEGKTTLGMIMKLCISRYYEVFDEMLDRSEAVPVTRSALRAAGNEPIIGMGFGGLGTGMPGAGLPPSGTRASTDSSPAGSASGVLDAPAPCLDGLPSRTGGETDPAQITHRRGPSTGGDDEDEDIDDAMLVMPMGPSHGRNGSVILPNSNTPVSEQQKPTADSSPSHAAPSSPNGQNKATPPSAWGSSSPPSGSVSGSGTNGPSTFKPKHRTTLSRGSGSGVRSMIPPSSSAIISHGTTGKAKSMISLENATITAKGGRKGSISVGTSRRNSKSTGAGVEAIGITAEGFFSAPSPRTSSSTSDSIPPVPSLPRLPSESAAEEMS